jgi:hypothetical protein
MQIASFTPTIYYTADAIQDANIWSCRRCCWRMMMIFVGLESARTRRNEESLLVIVIALLALHSLAHLLFLLVQHKFVELSLEIIFEIVVSEIILVYRHGR